MKILKPTISRFISLFKKPAINTINKHKGNLLIKGNRVFIDGLEIETNTTSGIKVTEKNGKILVNERLPNYK